MKLGFVKWLLVGLSVVMLSACGGGGGTDPIVKQSLKKTGQVSSYNAAGTEITDDSIKDDGYYQAGITPSYTRDNTTNIVTDNIIGLEWQDDLEAKTVTKQWLTTTNYNDCNNNGNNCENTTGVTATTYCSDLMLDGSGWRLPTIDELMYIADRSKRTPAIDTSYFKNVGSSLYWSSTTVVAVGFSSHAWGVNSYDGYDDWGAKSLSHSVRCVRDGQP